MPKGSNKEPGSASRTLTIRMPEEEYEGLQAVSLLTGDSMSEIAREGITDMLDATIGTQEQVDALGLNVLTGVQKAIDVLSARVANERGTESAS
jgi:predicted DNA-binding protein